MQELVHQMQSGRPLGLQMGLLVQDFQMVLLELGQRRTNLQLRGQAHCQISLQ